MLTVVNDSRLRQGSLHPVMAWAESPTALPTTKAQRPLAVLGFKREPKDVMVWLDGTGR